LSNLLTTNQIEKPFSVVIQGAVGQHYTVFGTFTVGALVSMLLPIVILVPFLVAARRISRG
jgi:hypothetical protein